MMDLPGKMHNAIVNRLKVMGNLQIDRRLSQQGHIYALLNGKEIVIPISVRRMSNDFEAVTI